MKALVLAGGSGSRRRPITHTYAKQLLPVANKPVLFYGLEAIHDAGITDVGIVVGDTAPAIEDAVGYAGASPGSPPPTCATLRGLAHAVVVARDFLGDDDFSARTGLQLHPRRDHRPGRGVPVQPADAKIMLTSVPDPRQFGVAELDTAGEVVGLEEKPQHPKSDLALVGVYIFTPAVH